MNQVCVKLIAIIFLGSIFSGCDATNNNDSASKKVPVEIPFYPEKVGETYSFDVQITQQLEYLVGVEFYIAKSNMWTSFFPRKIDPVEFQKLKKAIGAAELVNRQWLEPGLPATLHVQIINKLDGKTILDETVRHSKSRGSGYGRIVDLVKKILPQGGYTVQVKYLEGAPELAPLKANLVLIRAHHGK